MRGGALFIVLQGRFRAWCQLQAGRAVVLNFHAKGELQRMTSGAGRPAGLGVTLIPHRLLVDAPNSLLKSVTVAWLQRRQLGAGRPHQDRSAWLWLASAVRCSVMLVTCCTFVLKSVWVLVEWFVTDCGPKWTWYTPFGLNGLFVSSTWSFLDIVLRTISEELHGGIAQR